MYSNNVTNMDLNENSVKASIERMLSFWQQLFSSQHPTMCRPRIDIELTVPMGQSVQDEHERHEEDINVTRLLLEKEKGKGKGKGKGKATTAISSPRCKGDNTGSDLVNNESPTILPETVISTGRHIPVPRMTLLVIGHSIPFQLLLKSLTIHQIEKNGGNFNNGINQELLKWRNEKDTLLKAQEMDFEMPNGTFTEILMTGHRRFDASMGIVTAGINTDNKENMPSKQWQWQGIVGR